jgi:hypothetical protein
MSDAQKTREYEMRRQLERALALVRAAAEEINADSAIDKINISALNDFEHDEILSRRAFEEKVCDAY